MANDHDYRIEDLRDALPRPDVRTLDNGMIVCVLPARDTGVVASALVYRAGARDDAVEHAGTAHFLEHMMFKGSKNFAAGEVDRTTRAEGGSNNAFTSHDMTLYDFTFAADRWDKALEIEVDRMADLTLDPVETESERRVILEEIAMYESEPWDALEQEVSRTLYGDHPYGRPVLGTRESLQAVDEAVLARFHRSYYRPSNAVLVLGGDLGPEAHDRAAETFAGLPASEPQARSLGMQPTWPDAVRRVERRFGDVSRLLVALPGPPFDDPEHAALRLLVGILGSGRASRLHRALVDEGQLCVGVTADLSDPRDAGMIHIAAQLLPGVEPRQVEEVLWKELEDLRAEPPSDEEIRRARRILLADWTFGHVRVQQQAHLVAAALALWDLERPWRELERQLLAGPDELLAAARYLDPERGGVVGWSLPDRAENRSDAQASGESTALDDSALDDSPNDSIESPDSEEASS